IRMTNKRQKYGALSHLDEEIVKLRESEMTWPEVAEEIEKVHGIKTNNRSVQTRYYRYLDKKGSKVEKPKKEKQVKSTHSKPRAKKVKPLSQDVKVQDDGTHVITMKDKVKPGLLRNPEDILRERGYDPAHWRVKTSGTYLQNED